MFVTKAFCTQGSEWVLIVPSVARIRNPYYLFLRTDTLVLSVDNSNKSHNTFTWALGIHSGAAYLRPCLHGVGDPGLVG